MKRAFLAVAAAAVLAAGGLVVAPAGATSSDVMHGGCYFDTSPRYTGDTMVGVIGDASVTTTGDSPPAPIGATVTCWIQVNGTPAPGTRHSYGDAGGVPGIQAGSDPLVFDATKTDDVALCTSVVFADGFTDGNLCPPIDTIQIPPQTVVDHVEQVCDLIDPRPTVCDIFQR